MQKIHFQKAGEKKHTEISTNSQGCKMINFFIALIAVITIFNRELIAF